MTPEQIISKYGCECYAAGLTKGPLVAAIRRIIATERARCAKIAKNFIHGPCDCGGMQCGEWIATRIEEGQK